MRWILCGKNDAAARCLDFLVDRGDEVWAVGNAGDDGRNGWQRSFKAAALAHGVRFDQPRRINQPDFVARLADFGADALVSIQYDQILKGPLFEALDHPCLNLHFALLPRHRGVAPVAWAILEGDDEAGVTLHHMVVDIDAGDVLARSRVPIGVETTARELYDAISEASVALFREWYPFPAARLATRLAQDDTRACYHRAGELDFSQRAVDWGRPAAALHRWIRALAFPPMQWAETALDGRRLFVKRLRGAPEPAEDAPPGRVLSADADGVLVAAKQGAIRLAELEAADGARVEIAEGMRLGGPEGDTRG